MQYMKLNPDQREEFLAALAKMPDFLNDTFRGLSTEQTRAVAPDGTPSPVEQVWHLADLEHEGFAERIRRLASELDPFLPDFDGTKVAAERNYRTRSLRDGLAAFTEARQRNIVALRRLDHESWYRSGTQEGVGKVSLCDIPGFMSQHDAAHRIEIDAWIEQVIP